MTGEIFDIKRYAVHDGPGVRCTAFLKGCPLACVWCHNPEGKRPGPEICLTPSACIRCGACAGACPTGAATLDSADGAAIHRGSCSRCGACARACPAGAITAKGSQTTPEQLVEQLAKDEVFFQTSGGGITLSGGDPLFQPTFAERVLRLARDRGYHTAVETSLFAPAQVVEGLLDLVDLWLCDLKILDEAEHERLAGGSNRPILDNYALLASRQSAMVTRVPVIPGCTDSQENLTAIGRYVAAVNPGAPVELMFYNPLGESKYRSYGMDYALPGRRSYSQEEKSRLQQLVDAAIEKGGDQ